jgi:ribosomal protein L37AE/L43A
MPDKDHVCPICLEGEESVAGKGNMKNGAWVIDHCHDTDTFRGWLCHKCNRSLGGFDDSVEVLKRAIQYLMKHKERINETDT